MDINYLRYQHTEADMACCTVTPWTFLSKYEPQNEFTPHQSFALPGCPAAGAVCQMQCIEQPLADGRELEDRRTGILAQKHCLRASCLQAAAHRFFPVSAG